MTAPISLTDLSPFMRYKIDPWLLVKEGRVWTLREDSDDDDVRILMPPKPHIFHHIRLWMCGDAFDRSTRTWKSGKAPHPWAQQALEQNPDFDPRFQSHKKSRRMMMTWLMSFLHVWYAASNPGRTVGVGAKKAANSDYLLRKRYRFIFDNLDPECFDGRKPEVHQKENYMEFSNGSHIMGFAADEDGWRQFTFTKVHLEEVAFWDAYGDTYAGLRPATSQATIVSTPLDGTDYKHQFQNEVI